MSSRGSVRPSDKNDKARSSDARKFLAILLRERKLILGILGVAFVGSIVFTIFAPRVYQSSTTVRINTSFTDTPTPLFLDQVRSSGPAINPLQSELEVLRSRSLADTVAGILIDQSRADSTRQVPILFVQINRGAGARDTIAPRDLIIKRLMASIVFEPLRESDLIRITGKSESPAEAALLANTYSSAYYERTINSSRSKSRSTRMFLEMQLKDKQRELTEAEDTLRTYMQAKGVVSLDEESKRVVNQLSDLEASRNASDIAIQTLEQTDRTYTTQMADQEKKVAESIGESGDPYIRQVQEQLATLEVERDVARSQTQSGAAKGLYVEKLKEVDARIAALRASLRSRTDKFIQGVLPAGDKPDQGEPASYLRQIKQKRLEAELDIQSQTAKRAALDKAVRDYTKQFQRIPAKNIEYARLERNRRSIEKLYLLIQEKYNQAGLLEQSEFGFAEIIDLAVVPADASSPRVFLNLALGVVLGRCLGVGVAVGRERLAPRVQPPDDLKKSGYSVLATIMRHDAGQKKPRWWNSRLKSGPGSPHTPWNNLVTVAYPFASAAESFRYMRTNLQNLRRERPVKTILFTSSNPGEGKTTSIANLAVVLAQMDKTVILLDADLRKPTIHLVFDAKLEPGLSNALANNLKPESVIQRTKIDRLSVISCGDIPGNPGELLSSDAMKKMLDRLTQSYDYVLIDSPPVFAAADPIVLARMSDLVVVVVAAGDTRTNELESTVEALGEVNDGKPGVVVNKFDLQYAYGMTYGRHAYGHYRYEYSKKSEISDRGQGTGQEGPAPGGVVESK